MGSLGCTGIALVLAACEVPQGRPPIARIKMSPGAIPENDGFTTSVTLDGTASADPIDDPSGESPLTYHWQIEGDDHRFESGGETDAKPVARFGGDRPATITLTVTDVEGREGTVSENLRLTVRTSLEP